MITLLEELEYFQQQEAGSAPLLSSPWDGSPTAPKASCSILLNSATADDRQDSLALLTDRTALLTTAGGMG